MTRKAQLEGAVKAAPKPSAALVDVLAAFIAKHPDKWEEMRLWPAQSAFAEIVKLAD